MTMQCRGTQHFNVCYDDVLGDNGRILADAVLGQCEDDLASMSSLFAGIMPASGSLPFQVNLVPGTGGATHPSCLSTTITCFIYGASTPTGVPGLVDAEVAEVLMATQGKGFGCNASNGEALSRVIPTVLYPSLRPYFSVGNAWMNSSRPDWVTNTNPNDQDIVPIACGTLFLNYLAYQCGFSWSDIIAAAAPTLAQTAAILGVQNPFGDFSALLARHFPVGSAVELPDDNPFPLWPPSLSFDVSITDASGDDPPKPLPRALSVSAQGSHYTPGGDVYVAFHAGTIDGPALGYLRAVADNQGNFGTGTAGKAAGTPWRCNQQVAAVATDSVTGQTSAVATGRVNCL